uniref:Centromere protein S n=1 Tax=Syphacia muris TaxID=451379 RepID=A0A0N5AA22_9BILA
MIEDCQDEGSFVKTDTSKTSKKVDSKNQSDCESSENSIRMKLFSGLYYGCIQISRDINKEINDEFGKSVEFDGSVLAQTTRLLLDALTNTWPADLLKFAKHGRRSNVNVADFLLLFRKNKSLTEFINNFNEEQHAKRSKQIVKDSTSSAKESDCLVASSTVPPNSVDSKVKKKSTRNSSVRSTSTGAVDIKKFLNRSSKFKKTAAETDCVSAINTPVLKKRKCDLPNYKLDNDKEENSQPTALAENVELEHLTPEDVLLTCTSMAKRLCLKDNEIEQKSIPSRCIRKSSCSANEKKIVDNDKIFFDLDENSRDSFDGVDWDAIDSIGNDSVGFTAFHFESDDDDDDFRSASDLVKGRDFLEQNKTGDSSKCDLATNKECSTSAKSAADRTIGSQLRNRMADDADSLSVSSENEYNMDATVFD